MNLALLIGQLLTLAGVAVLGLLIYKQRQQLMELRDSTNRIRRHTAKTVDEVARREFRQVEALLSLRDLVDLPAPLAPTRNWAASPDVLMELARLIQREQPKVILECGGGTSTVVMAALARRYGGRVITLEHLAEYRNATQAAVNAQGLSDSVEIRLAPLTEINDMTFNGERFRWYDPAALQDLPEIDLFFIDGPPESTGKFARYPALPLLWGKASSRAMVVLDDTVREDEKAISQAWATHFGLETILWTAEKGAHLLRRS